MRSKIELFAAEAGSNQRIGAGDPEKSGANGSGNCRGHFLDLARQLTS